jgi:hypothetical protein
VLIPIRRLSDVRESDLLDDELAELMAAQFTGAIGPLAAAFTMTAGEMCDNATSHGKSDIVGASRMADRREHRWDVGRAHPVGPEQSLMGQDRRVILTPAL